MEPARTDPARWLADYEKTVARAAANARATGEILAQLGGTAASPRGEVTVTVNASGALTGLKLTPVARALEAARLAELILATSRQAQRMVGERVVDVMTDYVGDGPALEFVKRILPSAPDTEVPMADIRADEAFTDLPGIIR
jgi:hypothetical protein